MLVTKWDSKNRGNVVAGKPLTIFLQRLVQFVGTIFRSGTAQSDVLSSTHQITELSRGDGMAFMSEKTFVSSGQLGASKEAKQKQALLREAVSGSFLSKKKETETSNAKVKVSASRKKK